MTINSVGSSFDYIPPVRATRETAATARAAEASESAAATSRGKDPDWPPRVASEKVREARDSSVYGRLVAAQEEAASMPHISSRDASRAYAKGL